MADLQKLVDDLSELTVIQAAELSKMLEEKWGVSAAAPVAVAAASNGEAAAAVEEQTEIECHPGILRRKEDQRDQGNPSHHRPRPERGQGAGGVRAEVRQGRREQGRGRGVEDEARRRRRDGRAEVAGLIGRMDAGPVSGPGIGSEYGCGPGKRARGLVAVCHFRAATQLNNGLAAGWRPARNRVDRT